MPRNLSFKEALERHENVLEQSHDPSDSQASPETVGFLLYPVEISQPVDVAKALMRLGMPLRKAHATLNRLALKKVTAVELDVASADIAISKLRELGVAAARTMIPNPDVRKIRESYGDSQTEFANHFGLQVDAIRNWEQGRNQPDLAARLLLKIIEMCPRAVEYALTDQAAPLSIRWNEPKAPGPASNRKRVNALQRDSIIEARKARPKKRSHA
jgi:DNA-binding transcriptional regulator YiaG